MSDPPKDAPPQEDAQKEPSATAPPKKYFDDTPGAKNIDTSRAFPTFTEAAKTIQLEDFTKVHKQICVREALLVGIAAGFGFGGVKLVLRSTVKSAANWAVATFCGGSIVSFEMCHLRRGKEIEGMLQARYLMERKATEKKQKEERLRLEKDRRKREEIEAAKRWYKPWTWRT